MEETRVQARRQLAGWSIAVLNSSRKHPIFGAGGILRYVVGLASASASRRVCVTARRNERRTTEDDRDTEAVGRLCDQWREGLSEAQCAITGAYEGNGRLYLSGGSIPSSTAEWPEIAVSDLWFQDQAGLSG